MAFSGSATATVAKKFKSVLRAQLLSGGATDTFTIAHGLKDQGAGVSPHDVRLARRSFASNPSIAETITVASWNASLVTILIGSASYSGQYDVFCEFWPKANQ